MEQNSKAFKVPLSLFVLDAIGSILIGLGLAKMFAGIDFLPTALQLDKKGWGLIIIGVLLMLPMIFHFLARAREQAETKIIK